MVRSRSQLPPPLLAGALLRLPIRQTWDGQPLGVEEQVDVLLRGGVDELVLEVDAPFHGDPAPPSAVGPCPGLWNHEVVELMLLGADEHYLEVELSPRGHHLVLQLAGRRQPVQQGLALDFRAETYDTGRAVRWRGRARLPHSWLPAGCDRVNAYAIHGVGQARRYLAYQAPGGEQPDFHQLECFVTLDVALARSLPSILPVRVG